MHGLELATCHLALPPAGPVPEWVHLLPAGRIEGRDGRSFDLPDPAGLILSFQSAGVDLPVDYEHQNDKAEARLHGPVPAAGWIKELKADAQGVWGRVEWTATARELISRKEYRYLSPSFLFHPKTRQIMRLKGAGLVHNPNLYLTALASQEDPMNQPPPAPGKADTTPAALNLAAFASGLATLLGLPESTKPEAILAALTERLLEKPDPAKYMRVAAVQSMLAERLEERRELSADRATAKVDRAFREGYITRGMRGWAMALCRSDEAAFDSFITSFPPAFAHLVHPSHTGGLPPAARDARPVSENPLALAVCEQLGLKPEDLAD